MTLWDQNDMFVAFISFYLMLFKSLHTPKHEQNQEPFSFWKMNQKY